MEKIFTSFVLIGVSLCLFYINRKYKKACLKRVHLEGLNAFFFDMVFDVLLFMIVTNYLFPAITHPFFGFSVLYNNAIAPSELAIVYVVEFISWIIFYQTFYTLCKKHRILNYNLTYNKTLGGIIIFILLLYIFSRLSTLGVQEGEPTQWEQRLFFIIPFVNIAGYMLAVFIVFAGVDYFPKSIWLLAIGAMLAFFLGAFLSGIRGAVVNPIVWAAYVVYKLRPSKVRRNYYILFGFVLVVFTLVQPIFMGFRAINSENINVVDKIEMAQRIAGSKSLQNSDARYRISNIFEELDYRYGAQGTYTVGFYRLVEREGYVGLNCIINSFYTFMPSVLYGGKKPVSTSSDGTAEGMGMYKCVNAIDGSNNMCGFFTSGHAYWEFGVFGIIIFSIIPAFFDYWCIRIFRRLDIIGVPLYTVIFMKSFTELKMWVSLIVVEFAQFILPVFILIFIYNALYHKSKNNKFKTAYNS